MKPSSLTTSIRSSRYRLALFANPGARASRALLRFFRFLRDNGSLGHAFVLHQRFELRQGELQNLNCLPQLRCHHELLTQPKVMSEFYFENHW